MSEHRPVLFSGGAWFNKKWDSSATEELEARREVREAMKEASKVVDTANDELWESLMHTHIEEGFDE